MSDDDTQTVDLEAKEAELKERFGNRDHAGYEWYDESFNRLDVWSAPTLDHALDHFFDLHDTFPKSPPIYIAAHTHTDYKMKMLPYRYSPETEEVEDIG